MFHEANFIINKEDLIAVLMDKAPDQYASVITVEQAIKKDQLCLLEDLCRAMINIYHMDVKHHKDVEDKNIDKQVSLGAMSGTSNEVLQQVWQDGTQRFPMSSKKKREEQEQTRQWKGQVQGNL